MFSRAAYGLSPPQANGLNTDTWAGHNSPG
jgi:hypothetical protein